MKTWNVGNTTVRNPLRIEEGLMEFKSSIAGIKWKTPSEWQKKLYDALLTKELIDSTTGDEQESLARKWKACFMQLGFIIVDEDNNLLDLSEAGEALIQKSLPDEDIFLKQLMKLNLPNFLENGAKYSDIDIHPFWLFVNCLYFFHKISSLLCIWIFQNYRGFILKNYFIITSLKPII